MSMGSSRSLTTLEVARSLIAGGLSIVPIVDNGRKYPGPSHLLPKRYDKREDAHKPSWKPYQERFATKDELSKWFGPGGTKGIGIVCGGVSGHLEMIDFDTKDSLNLYNQWAEIVELESPGLVDRLITIPTPGVVSTDGVHCPGTHVPYRCPEVSIPGSQKLAKTLRDPSQPRSKNNPVCVMIETRGEGGLFVTHPTPASYHATGKPYGPPSGDLASPPVVSAQERDVMLTAARSLNLVVDDIVQDMSDVAQRQKGNTQLGNRPGDDFNTSASNKDVCDILVKYGWKEVHLRGDVIYLCRPGKKLGCSATLGYAERNLFHVFSSNAHPFDQDRAYRPFGVYTLLEHAGDFSAAAKALASQGYGDPDSSIDRESSGEVTTIELPNPDTGEITHAPATLVNVLKSLHEVSDDHDARHDWALGHIEALAQLTETELEKVKADLRRGKGKLSLRDMQGVDRAVKAHIRDLELEKLQRQQNAWQEKLDPDNPIISITDRPLREITADAVAALENMKETDRLLFVRAGELVRIRVDENGRPLIESVTKVLMTHFLARAAYFVSQTPNGPQHRSPPSDVTDDILALGKWPFPPLEAIVEIPTLRQGGSVLDSPGYDPLTHLFYMPAADLGIPSIPEVPTTEEVTAAVSLIDEVIRDFPFVDAPSRAGAFALLMTPFVQPAIPGHRPFALIESPMPGTGKSLLADVAGVIATGRDTPMMSAPGDRNEWRKGITSVLRDGSTYCVIDNLEGKLSSPELSQVATAMIWKDRILGRSEMIDLPNRAVWVATGNNICLGGDLPRRCYLIRLDAKTGKPWLRDQNEFTHPELIIWIKANRSRLIAAILTVARAWFLADQPMPSKSPVLGSFEGWCNVLGGILEYVNITGFLDNLQTLYEQSDEDTPQLEAFFAVWHVLFEDQPLTVADLAEYVAKEDCLKDVLPAGFSDLDLPSAKKNAQGNDVITGDLMRFKHRLGNLLKKKRDGFYGLYSVRHAGQANNKARLWKMIGPPRGDAETQGDSNHTQLLKNDNTRAYRANTCVTAPRVEDGALVSPIVSASPRHRVEDGDEI